MSKVLTLFLLCVFAILALVMVFAEAVISPDAEPTTRSIVLEESELFFVYAAVRDAEFETVSIVLRWPHEDVLRLGLDAHDPIGRMNSATEGRSRGTGIQPGGESRL